LLCNSEDFVWSHNRRTLGFSRWEWPERGTSGGYSQSAANPCSAQLVREARLLLWALSPACLHVPPWLTSSHRVGIGQAQGKLPMRLVGDVAHHQVLGRHVDITQTPL